MKTKMTEITVQNAVACSRCGATIPVGATAGWRKADTGRGEVFCTTCGMTPDALSPQAALIQKTVEDALKARTTQLDHMWDTWVRDTLCPALHEAIKNCQPLCYIREDTLATDNWKRLDTLPIMFEHTLQEDKGNLFCFYASPDKILEKLSAGFVNK